MKDANSRPRRHPNESQKRSLKAGEVATFLRQYGRKAQKATEPNDRSYSVETARKIRRLNPMELDRLIREDED